MDNLGLTSLRFGNTFDESETYSDCSQLTSPKKNTVCSSSVTAWYLVLCSESMLFANGIILMLWLVVVSCSDCFFSFQVLLRFLVQRCLHARHAVCVECTLITISTTISIISVLGAVVLHRQFFAFASASALSIR